MTQPPHHHCVGVGGRRRCVGIQDKFSTEFLDTNQFKGNMMPTLSDANNKTQKKKRGPSNLPMPLYDTAPEYRIGTSNKCSQKLSLTVSFNRNAPMIRAHPYVREGGCYEVHEIEDLVKLGEMVQGCSYFGAQAMADIVFCPYNYILLS
ncbi:fanconi anemia group J protein [Tanacetum coccineum]